MQENFRQFLDRLRLVALRIELGFDDERPAAFGFFRPRRPVRDPGLVAEFPPPLAQQVFQRMGGRRHPKVFPMLAAQQRRQIAKRGQEAGSATIQNGPPDQNF